MADFAVTPASVLPSAKAVTAVATAAAALQIGDAVALDANRALILFDANNAADGGVRQIFAGLSLSAVAIGQKALYVKQDASFAPGFAVAANAIVIGSATPGKLAPYSDNATGLKLTIVGVGIGANKIKLAPFSSGVATP